MIKQERTDITSELKFPFILFGDGYMAQLLEIVPGKNQENQDIWKIRLIPTNELAKKHRIGLEMLDESRSLVREFPMEMIKPWSLDPTWSIYVCYLNVWGEETVATKYIKGKLDADLILDLKKEISLLRARNAYLEEQNYKLKTNVRQYVQEDIMGIADLMNISVGQTNPPGAPQLTGVIRTGAEA